MLTLFRSAVRALLFDELAARRWLRSAVMALGVGGATYAEQLSQIVGHADAIKAVSVAAAAVSVLINLGEKNKP